MRWSGWLIRTPRSWASGAAATLAAPYIPYTQAMDRGPQLLPEGSELGRVHLHVTDAERARVFWTRYVGLTETPSDGDSIHLGVENKTLLVLHPDAGEGAARRSTGLYHVAIHVPEQKDLALLVARLATLEYAQSPTDHTATMATYFDDPDGIGIEITYETPERGRMLILPDGRPVAQLTGESSYRGVTEALDVQDLLSVLGPDDDLSAPLPAGTCIGHVHLHMRDIETGRNFFERLIGFHLRLHMSNIGMSDYGLDQDTEPHSLAINSWNGPGAEPRPEGSAGLKHWELLLPAGAALEELKGRLDAEGWSYDSVHGGISLRDPSGTELRVLTAP